MIQKISVPVSVDLFFDHHLRRVLPRQLVWEGQPYLITKIGLHHTYREGRTLYHVFSVATKEMFFRLVLDSDTLFWRLEEVADGLPE